MFCTICNLHFPDNLNFCRRCGRALVHSTADIAVDALFCTKCGTKVTRFDKFCTLCDNQVDLKNEETVIGACRSCGTSWRSTWFFCKTCGLEREDGLQSPLSLPLSRRSGAVSLKDDQTLDRSVSGSFRQDESPSLAYAQTAPPAGSPPQAPLPNYMPANSSMPTIIESRPSDSLPKIKISNKANKPKPKADYTSPAPQDYLKPAFDTDFARQPRYATVIGSIKQQRKPGRKTQIPKIPIISLLLVGTVSLVAWMLFRSSPAPIPDASGTQKKVVQVPRLVQSALQTNTVTPDIKPTSIAAPTGMIFIPGGKFLMGRNGGDDYDSPQIAVETAPFYIDKTEVTNAAYQKFVEATGKRVPTHWINGRIPRGQESYPVINVSWNEALAYARWAGKRLPTEPEWEFAARGKDQRIYPWGNYWNPNFANVGKGETGKIVQVGRFEAGKSPFGILDMSGNVWEWTADDPISYSDRSRKLATGKVVRGGAFNVLRMVATTTYRGILSQDRGYDKTGFRCAADYVSR